MRQIYNRSSMSPTHHPPAPYAHTQTAGFVFFVVLGLGMAGAAVAITVGMFGGHARGSGTSAGWPVAWAALVFVVVVGIAGLVLFSSLTVQLDDRYLSWWFGPGRPGLIRKSVPLSEVREVTVVQNPLWYGWGIHLTPRGWLYNVAGREGVEVTLMSGQRFRLGTDEPETLARAIVERISA